MITNNLSNTIALLIGSTLAAPNSGKIIPSFISFPSSTALAIETKEYPTPATRPHYSLLNKSKIKKEYNITIPYWKDSLKQCLKQLGESK